MKMFSGNKSKRVYHVAWKHSVNASHEKDSRQKISFVDVAISGSPSPPSPAREFHFRPFLSGGSFSILLRGGFFAFFGTVTLRRYLRLSGGWQTDKRSKSPHFLQLFAFLFFIYSMGCGPSSGNSAAVGTTATSSSNGRWIEAYL